MQEWLESVGVEVWPVVWDVFVTVFVPILVGAAAAGVVVSQLNQVKRHRVADRRAEGVAELGQMMLENADLAIRGIDNAIEAYRAFKRGGDAPETKRITQLDRFRHNAYYVRAQARLSEDSASIGNWALQRSSELFDQANAALAAEGDPERKVGEARKKAMTIAVDTIRQLLMWLRGDVDTAWFETQVDNDASE